METQAPIDAIKRSLEADPIILLAWVYGSFAHGEPTATSDIDVAVAAEKPLSLEQRVQITQRLSKAAAREVDLVDLTVERGVIASQVLSRGILIIKKNRDLLANLIKRTWLDRADYWPHRERIFSARRKKAFNA